MVKSFMTNSIIVLICIHCANLQSVKDFKNAKYFKNNKFTEYTLNPEKLDVIFHTVAIFTLLKSKATSILKQEPRLEPTEGVIYKQCSLDAKTAVQEARCVVGLLRARDALRLKQNEQLENMNTLSKYKNIENDFIKNPQDDMDWFTKIQQWFLSIISTKTNFKDNNYLKKVNNEVRTRIFAIDYPKVKEKEKIREANKQRLKSLLKIKYTNNRQLIQNLRKDGTPTFKQWHQLHSSKNINLIKLINTKNKSIKSFNYLKKKYSSVSFVKNYFTFNKPTLLFQKYKINSMNQKQLYNKNFQTTNFLRWKRTKRDTKLNLLETLKPDVIQHYFLPNLTQIRRRNMIKIKDKIEKKSSASFSRLPIYRSVPNIFWFKKALIEATQTVKKLIIRKGLIDIITKTINNKKKFGRRKRRSIMMNRYLKSRNYKFMYDMNNNSDNDSFYSYNKKATKRSINLNMLETKRNHRSINKNNYIEFENIEKLKKIFEFYKMLGYCQQFMKNMGDSNSQYLKGIDKNFMFNTDKPQEDDFLFELENHLKNFTFENFPILSPKFFSLFPDEKESSQVDGRLRPSLLSPNMFSFHKEGIFSLPNMFQLISNEETEITGWLDLFIEASGANKLLDKILLQIEPKTVDLRNKLYPIIQQLEAYGKRWKLVKSTFTPNQKMALEEYGYALLDLPQLQLLHCNEKITKEKIEQLFRQKRETPHQYKELSQNEEILEDDIYKIAKLQDKIIFEEILNNKNISMYTNLTLDKSNVYKVVGQNHSDNILKVENSIAIENIGLLQPFLFNNRLKDGPIISHAVLSPKAFVTNLLKPSFLTDNVLGPQAFVPTILSPHAMLAAIISPTAFTANILTPNTLFADILTPKVFHTNIVSPRALSAVILSPRVLLFEVLSPKLIEFRALNPTIFYISVLTPNILMPRVLSPSSFGVSVLSPNILSPTVMSKGNFTVQILSPTIFSGELDLKALNNITTKKQPQ